MPGIRRIRFTSPHPAEVNDRLVDVMADCRVVAPQMHLPVQSGSDRVLARMARDYDTQAYEALVAKLRARVPGLVRVVVKGKGTSLVLPDVADARTTLVVGTPAECASVVWGGPTAPSPRCKGDATRMACK